jgi:hypothetical protein
MPIIHTHTQLRTRILTVIRTVTVIRITPIIGLIMDTRTADITGTLIAVIMGIRIAAIMETGTTTVIGTAIKRRRIPTERLLIIQTEGLAHMRRLAAKAGQPVSP